MGLGKGSIKAVVAELYDGNQCSIIKSRENVGAAGSEGELVERKQCGMCGLNIGAIGQTNKDAIRGGDFVGAGSVGANEMAGAAGVSDGAGLEGNN